ncbi:MAG: septation protein A [Rhizobiales bacterium]|nr:septation protein A [Hyphomicrobiales bacterium]
MADLRPAPARPHVNPALKFALELGPLLLFFGVNYIFTGKDAAGVDQSGLVPATAALMAGVVVALIVSRLVTGKIPVMPLVTAVFVLIFGGLTLALNNPTFIKLKPTIVNALFGSALLGGLAFNRPLLPIVLDSVLHLTEEGWRKLTFRWGLFFFVLAALNEIVWRTQSESFWVNFKVFGVMPLTLIFALTQTPLILKHELKPEQRAAEPDHF